MSKDQREDGDRAGRKFRARGSISGEGPVFTGKVALSERDDLMGKGGQETEAEPGFPADN